MRSKTIIIIVLLLIIGLYAMEVVASIGRFTNTHSIVVQSYCVDCHQRSLKDIDESNHMGAMGVYQSVVIDNWFAMMNNTNISNYEINGLCLSCHNVRSDKFGFTDAYIYSISSGGNVSNVAAIDNIVLWNNSWGSGVYNGEMTETITVNIKVQDVIPANASVIVDTTVQLLNFSGVQDPNNVSKQCICNDTEMNIIVSNIYADYFKVYIDVAGEWNFSSLNVSVSGYPSVMLNSSGSSPINFYNLPIDLSSQYSYLTLFHTQSNYSVKRMDMFIEEMKNASVTSISINSQLMTDNIGNVSKYTCSSADALCHINQKITDGGQKLGIIGMEKERYYSHNMPYVTDNICENCHL